MIETLLLLAAVTHYCAIYEAYVGTVERVEGPRTWLAANATVVASHCRVGTAHYNLTVTTPTGWETNCSCTNSTLVGANAQLVCELVRVPEGASLPNVWVAENTTNCKINDTLPPPFELSTWKFVLSWVFGPGIYVATLLSWICVLVSEACSWSDVAHGQETRPLLSRKAHM